MLMTGLGQRTLTACRHPLVQWPIRTAYYLFILIALLWIYGTVDQSPATTFVYNEF